MKELTEKQRNFLALLMVGEYTDVATSQYSLDPNPSTGWNPHVKTSASTINSLVKKGYIEADVFWRGAIVKRIR